MPTLGRRPQRRCWRSGHILVLLSALASASGCRTRYSVREPASGASRVYRADFLLWGAVTRAEVDVRSLCEHGADSVEVGGDVATLLTTMVTLGIYAPQKVRVWCRRAPSSRGEGGR